VQQYQLQPQQRVAKATIEMLKRLDHDQAVAAAEKTLNRLKKLKRILMDWIRPEIGQISEGSG
jgi:ABC-type arginine transport system ATPase subunit